MPSTSKRLRTADAAVNRLYPKGEFDLFAGDQVVLVGRYHASGKAKVKLTGKIGDEEKSFDFPADLVDKSDDDTNAFVAKLWATRRVGEIIDEMDLKGRNEELVKELVALATEHGILTPYTSFLADEDSDVRDVPLNRSRALSESEVIGRNVRPIRRSQQRREEDRLPNGKPGPAAAKRTSGPAPSRLRSAGGGYFGGNVLYYDAKKDNTSGRQLPPDRPQDILPTRRPAGRFNRHRGQEKSAKKIERYSREYFDLIERYGKHVAQYLALDEPICINLGGETYEW